MAVIRNPVFTIEGVDYTGQATKARLVPETPVQTLRTLDPDTVLVDVDSPTWTFELAGIQQGTLAAALDAATPGDVLEVVLQLAPGTGKPVRTFNILAMPTPFGGEQGAHATFDLSFPVVDQPAKSTSV